MIEKMELRDDQYCFVCGKNNKDGLHLDFVLDGEILKTKFRPGKKYQGYADIVHGGIIGLVLDEMLINLPWKLGIKAVTAEYTVRLKKPVHIDEELEFSSWIDNRKGRLLLVSAEVKNNNGTLVGTASGKCMEI